MRNVFVLVCGAMVSFAYVNTTQASVVAATADTSVFIYNSTTNTYNQNGYAGSAGDGEVARDYLQFSIPIVADTYVSSASLVIAYQSSYSNASFPLSVYATTDAWSPSTITWNDQPGPGMSLAIFNPTVNNSTIPIDITDYVSGDYLQTGTVSVVVGATNEYFTSGSDNSWRYLNGLAETLSYTLSPLQVPEPASIVLLGAGLLSLGVIRRRPAR